MLPYTPMYRAILFVALMRGGRLAVALHDDSTPAMAEAPFAHYQLDQAYDEMFAAPDAPRAHYAALGRRLLTLPADELRRRAQAAERSFLQQGITFTVYGREEGTERII